MRTNGRRETDMSSAALQAVLRRLPELDRFALEHAIEAAIALMDALDGDTDYEDATDAEDEFTLTPLAIAQAGAGAGCPCADPGGHEDEDRFDVVWSDPRAWRRAA
jgi:hypothetical protein